MLGVDLENSMTLHRKWRCCRIGYELEGCGRHVRACSVEASMWEAGDM